MKLKKSPIDQSYAVVFLGMFPNAFFILYLPLCKDGMRYIFYTSQI
jgi:uncharacterized membrane protein